MDFGDLNIKNHNLPEGERVIIWFLEFFLVITGLCKALVVPLYSLMVGNCGAVSFSLVCVAILDISSLPLVVDNGPSLFIVPSLSLPVVTAMATTARTTRIAET